MNLSFVYPVYNEIDNLPRILPETERIADGLAANFEVVLVDDGSTDGSGAFIDDLAARHANVRALHHPRNCGLGAAIRTGLANATQDVVLYMDSDFPVGAEEARAALALLGDGVDVLIGYRLGRAEGMRREVMSWTYNRVIRWGFGLRVRDVNFAFKAVRRPILQQMRLLSEGSFIDAELLVEAQRLGARIAEVGIHYQTRTAGVSTAASPRVVLRIFGEMWRYLRGRGPAGPARAIVNADDFGLCEEVNRGIAEAFDRGIVTSASLLPTGEAFGHAVGLARARPELDLGIHLALTQAKPVSPAAEVPSLVGRGGEMPPDWVSFLRGYVAGRVRGADVERELRAQIERALAAGLSFSHLDSHQHLHMLPRILPIVVRLAEEYGFGAIRVPLQRRAEQAGGRRRAGLLALRALCRLGRRRLSANGLFAPDNFRGFAEAGRWEPRLLARTLERLDGGLTEIVCHPGADDRVDDELRWRYRWEQELAALTSPEVADAIARGGVRLTTYREALPRRDGGAGDAEPEGAEGRFWVR